MKSVKSATPGNPESAVRILKVETCASLSGKSKLKYQVGCNAASEVHFRITANDGGGFFNDEWIALRDIQEVCAKSPSGKPITSFLLNPLFRGQSANTPGFIFAALLSEGLVVPAKDKQRSYELADGKQFLSEVKALIASKVDLRAGEKPSMVDGKPQKAEAKPQKPEAKPHTAMGKSKPAATPKKAPSKASAKKKA